MVGNALHGLWEAVRLLGTEDIVPHAMRSTWEAYRDFIAAKNLPRERAGQVEHLGHCTYLLEDERQFVTPGAIRAMDGLVGEPDEIIEMLRERERAGLKEVLLLPPMEFAEELLTDFAGRSWRATEAGWSGWIGCRPTPFLLQPCEHRELDEPGPLGGPVLSHA